MKKNQASPAGDLFFWDGLSDLQRLGIKSSRLESQNFPWLFPTLLSPGTWDECGPSGIYLFKQNHGKSLDKLREKGVQVPKVMSHSWYFIFWKYTKVVNSTRNSLHMSFFGCQQKRSKSMENITKKSPVYSCWRGDDPQYAFHGSFLLVRSL